MTMVIGASFACARASGTGASARPMAANAAIVVAMSMRRRGVDVVMRVLLGFPLSQGIEHRDAASAQGRDASAGSPAKGAERIVMIIRTRACHAAATRMANR